MRKILYSAKLKDGRVVPLYLTDATSEIHTPEVLPPSITNPNAEYNGLRVNLNTQYDKSGKVSLLVPAIGLDIQREDIVEISSYPFVIEGRYGLFMGSEYYPSGGLEDLVYLSDSTDDLDVIVKSGTVFAMKFETDWFQIVDMHTLSIIKKGRG